MRISDLKEPVYIAGPMTGLPERNYPLFRKVEQTFRDEGLTDVQSPCAPDDHPDDPHPWDWYMRRAIAQVIQCNTMVLLPGWQASRGATVEHYLARVLRMDVYEYDELETA